jgi:hypothetical protein
MPDPQYALNAMTLAAQILAASALRKRGQVRGIIYSSGKPLVSEWMRDEDKAREFLLHYAGGGTDYPFDLLVRHAEERDDAIRVVISDSDFLWNVQAAGAMDKLRQGIGRSRLFIAFLALPDDRQAKTVLKPVLGEPKLRLVLVGSLEQFGKAAADLADAVLGA